MNRLLLGNLTVDSLPFTAASTATPVEKEFFDKAFDSLKKRAISLEPLFSADSPEI